MSGVAPPMYFMPGAAGTSMAPNSNHLMCGGCQTFLMYPAGASQVRCSRCGHITPAPAQSSTDQAQVVCNGCRVLLQYPRGASTVQCSVCHTITQVPVYGHLVCQGCSIMLMYPVGAQSVKCAVCHNITPVTASNNNSASQNSSQNATRPAAGAPNTTVVIENPPSVDEHGHEVANIAVGIKTDDR